jgi:hypothetical protein
MEKNILLLYNSLLRNYLKYEYGRGGFDVGAEDRGGGGCFLGFKIKCWVKYGGISVLKLIGYGILIVKTGGAGIAYVLVALAEAASAIYAAAFDECRCGNGGPAPPPPCKRPEAISVDLEGCGLTQKVKTWGYGTYSGTFIWELNGGVAPDYNNATMVETTVPWLRVTQTNGPSDKVFVSVVLKDCNEPTGGIERTQTFNFHELTAGPGTMQLWSKAPQTNSAHVVNIGAYHNYYIIGTALSKVNDGLATLSFQTTLHGAIQNDPSLPTGEIKVWWNVYTYNGAQNPIYAAGVTATATPICISSPPVTDDIPVAVYLPY